MSWRLHMFYTNPVSGGAKIPYRMKAKGKILIGIKYIFYFFIVLSGVSISAGDLPGGVCGFACFDFFTEKLPQKTKGIYKIYDRNDEINYIGSALDINQRLTVHAKNGILNHTNRVHAIIFESKTRQKEILNYEKFLINKLSPRLNKTNSAPGRPWRSEQLSKLQAFSVHNKHLLTDEGAMIIADLLNGKCLSENRKIAKSIFRLMRLLH